MKSPPFDANLPGAGSHRLIYIRTEEVQPNVLIDLDEWQHFFSKAGIENSSFTSFLHTAFYKRRQNVIVGRGKEIDVDCALSFIGGIVEDEFDTCFGVNSLGACMTDSLSGCMLRFYHRLRAWRYAPVFFLPWYGSSRKGSDPAPKKMSDKPNLAKEHFVDVLRHADGEQSRKVKTQHYVRLILVEPC